MRQKKIWDICITQLTGAYFCHITDEPVSPIEESSSWCAGMRPHSRHEGLNKAQNCSSQADGSVYRRRTPCAQFHEYYYEGCDRHRPSEHHEEPVPLEEKSIGFYYSERSARKVSMATAFPSRALMLNVNDVHLDFVAKITRIFHW